MTSQRKKPIKSRRTQLAVTNVLQQLKDQERSSRCRRLPSWSILEQVSAHQASRKYTFLQLDQTGGHQSPNSSKSLTVGIFTGCYTAVGSQWEESRSEKGGAKAAEDGEGRRGRFFRKSAVGWSRMSNMRPGGQNRPARASDPLEGVENNFKQTPCKHLSAPQHGFRYPPLPG